VRQKLAWRALIKFIENFAVFAALGRRHHATTKGGALPYAVALGDVAAQVTGKFDDVPDDLSTLYT
jgi:hypothetical protein